MESWTGAQRAFAVKAFYKYGDSFVIAQREFRGIHRNRAAPSAHAIKTWVRNFEATGSALTLRRLMSYIYGAPIPDVSRSHTTTQHSR